MKNFDPFEFAKNQFPFLQAEDVVSLLKSSRVKKLQTGEVFIERGKKTEKSALIIKGLLRGYRITSEGEEKNVLFRKEFEVIGSLQSMVMNEPTVEQVDALEVSWVFEFNFKRFRELSYKNIRISRAYNRIVELMLVDAVERIYAFTLESPEERYLNFAQKNRALVQRVPLKHLASYLGVTPWSLSRIRRRVAGK